ncbi:hypothetical protein FOQG_09660 [Fusarium oxysporum f. sp. raphani 54005]|uniref:Carboxymuconolactone decarboxylase-like domain-containing protein n=1 Tax=Fusarium oxysporum f. sp. raphani 54005 TaxID=1089458 RepID=X0C5D4_FUSOX|nr:hypothetical protein FOQG_09660 [Fusarium oxysporum f. sp. raphani 54005]
MEAEDSERVKETFLTVREAISLSAAFIGLPNTMPACFGVIAVLKKRGISEVTSRTSYKRPSFVDLDYITLGQKTQKSIYWGVGNSEVGKMIGQYLPDLSHFATTSIFGYLLGGCRALKLKDAEIIVASAIIGLGATRQARSHGKAALGQGCSIKALEAIDAVAHEVGKWNGSRLHTALDVPQLYEELQNELVRLKSIEQQ